jgi:transposase InsO family protein
MIPINEAHVRQTLKSWIVHYNRARPHSSLGPGMPVGGELLSLRKINGLQDRWILA